jgi:uncharacterized protein with HEPN domain
MHRNDLLRVRHMLDAAREARTFLHDQPRSALVANRVLVLALVRCIEVIGEAASQVSKEFQGAHAEIPWPQIIAMRNRLIHAYFDVDIDRVWDTVMDDLPSLIAQLERLMQSSP